MVHLLLLNFSFSSAITAHHSIVHTLHLLYYLMVWTCLVQK